MFIICLCLLPIMSLLFTATLKVDRHSNYSTTLSNATLNLCRSKNAMNSRFNFKVILTSRC